MDVLLTGASGFLGRNLVARWGERHRLYALGRTAVPGTVHLACDLERGLAVASLPDRVDIVVHLATSQSGPASIFRVNAQATLELLEAACARGARRFVLASTGTVYGWRDTDSDEETPLAPPDLYSHAKVMAEELVRAHRDRLETTVLRLYMPYGAGQRGRLLADLVARVREGRAVELVNGGAPVLNPIHIDDLLDVFDRALAVPGHALLNVGGTEALSVRDMAEAIGRALGRPPVFGERLRPGEPPRLVGRIDRLRDWLGQEPRVAFAAGLARSL